MQAQPEFRIKAPSHMLVRVSLSHRQVIVLKTLYFESVTALVLYLREAKLRSLVPHEEL